MFKTDELARKKFAEAVKMVEDAKQKEIAAWTMEGYFALQVGPEDAKVIMKQMETMFIVGFYEGLKSIISN